MKKEFPTTPEEAFTTGENRFFDQNIAFNIKTEKPSQIIGNWKYYGDFIVGHRYAGGADVSEGVGRHNSTIAVIDFDYKKEITGRLFTKPRVVGIYCNNKIAPDLFAHEIKSGGQRFGNCLMAPERNNHGFTTLSTLKGIYFNIYRDENEKLGWLTNVSSKPRMMHELRTAIQEDMIDIPDEDLKREILSMPSTDLNTVNIDEQDESMGHYDRIIALAIAWQMQSLANPGYVGELRDNEDNPSTFDRYSIINEL